MHININKLLAILSTTGTIGLTLVGCNAKKVNNVPEFTINKETTAEPIFKFSQITEPTLSKEEKENEQYLKNIRKMEKNLDLNPTKKTETMTLYHYTGNFDKICVYGTNLGSELTSEDYAIINEELKTSTNNNLEFNNINADVIDFSLINTENLADLAINYSKGTFNIEKLSNITSLKSLILIGTDFINLNKISNIDKLHIDYSNLAPNSTSSISISEIINDLKTMDLKDLFLGGFPVSYVPISLEKLAIDYQNVEVPSALVCSANSVGIYSTRDDKLEMPIIINDKSNKSLAVEGFNIGKTQCESFLEWGNVILGWCNLTEPIETITELGNVKFYETTIDYNLDYTYHSTEDSNDIIYYQKDKNGNETELFRISQEQAKIDTKKQIQ